MPATAHGPAAGTAGPDSSGAAAAGRPGSGLQPGADGRFARAVAPQETGSERPGTSSASERRAAILSAALAVFAQRGFDAARLDDIAAEAGVAKGTVYLYFRSKEELFEALIQSAAAPMLGSISAELQDPRKSSLAILRGFFAFFRREILETERKHIIRLVLTEGQRFPAIAKFYHQNVVSKGLAIGGELARRAVASGEFPTGAAVRFPQLIVAPLLLCVLWDALFRDVEPLDAGGLLAAHLESLTGGRGALHIQDRPSEHEEDSR